MHIFKFIGFFPLTDTAKLANFKYLNRVLKGICGLQMDLNYLDSSFLHSFTLKSSIDDMIGYNAKEAKS